MSVFGKLAKYYDLVHENKNYEQESSYVHGLIQKHNPEAQTILDIGCGTGNYAFAMQTLGYEVTGVDASSEMIEIAKTKLKEKNGKTCSGFDNLIGVDMKNVECCWKWHSLKSLVGNHF